MQFPELALRADTGYPPQILSRALFRSSKTYFFKFRYPLYCTIRPWTRFSGACSAIGVAITTPRVSRSRLFPHNKEKLRGWPRSTRSTMERALWQQSRSGIAYVVNSVISLQPRNPVPHFVSRKSSVLNGRCSNRRCHMPSRRSWRATLRDSPPDVERALSGGDISKPDWLSRAINPTLWPERFRVVFLCFLSFVICNCDRINISVAILPMAKYYGWSQTTVGIIQSAFFWGYVLTQIPGGYLADKYGGKQVLAVGVVVWSAMTLLTPIAASTNIGVLLLARALLGVGEGVAMPAMNNMISKWVPEAERSRSLSLTYSGMYLGSVVGLLLCPTFIVSFGWQSVFYIFGALGFFWWVAWQFLTKSTPEESTTISEKEKAYISANIPKEGFKPTIPTGVPWKLLFSEKATWAIIVAHFCATWGSFCILPRGRAVPPSHVLKRVRIFRLNC